MYTEFLRNIGQDWEEKNFLNQQVARNKKSIDSSAIRSNLVSQKKELIVHTKNGESIRLRSSDERRKLLYGYEN